MRRRVRRPAVKSGPDLPEAVLVSAAPMVTLDDPMESRPSGLQAAFVRLRPPEGTTPEDVAAWRLRVLQAGARAVRVLPPPAPALVPVAADRAAAQTQSFRDEALALANETKDTNVLQLTRRILDEVGV